MRSSQDPRWSAYWAIGGELGRETIAAEITQIPLANDPAREPSRVTLCLSEIPGTACHQREGEHHRCGDCRDRAHGVPRRPTRDVPRPFRRAVGAIWID